FAAAVFPPWIWVLHREHAHAPEQSLISRGSRFCISARCPDFHSVDQRMAHPASGASRWDRDHYLP
ncbi:uncharacterized protein A1O9_11681, partial [Exophiala aquamarina CBS 119918]